MKRMSFLDTMRLLRTFGVVIYTRDPIGDCILMEDELRDLYQAGLIYDESAYHLALLSIRNRMAELKKKSTNPKQ